MLELEKDLVFWREHNQQEISFNSHILLTLEHNIRIVKEKLYVSQLNEIEKNTIIQKYNKSTMRYLIKNVFKLGILKSYKLKKINQLKFSDAI